MCSKYCDNCLYFMCCTIISENKIVIKLNSGLKMCVYVSVCVYCCIWWIVDTYLWYTICTNRHWYMNCLTYDYDLLDRYQWTFLVSIVKRLASMQVWCYYLVHEHSQRSHRHHEVLDIWPDLVLVMDLLGLLLLKLYWCLVNFSWCLPFCVWFGVFLAKRIFIYLLPRTTNKKQLKTSGLFWVLRFLRFSYCNFVDVYREFCAHCNLV